MPGHPLGLSTRLAIYAIVLQWNPPSTIILHATTLRYAHVPAHKTWHNGKRSAYSTNSDYRTPSRVYV